MKRIATLVLLIVLSAASYAQGTKTGNFLRKVDGILERMHAGNKMDSSYVTIPSQKLAVRLASDITQGWINSRGMVGDDQVSMALKSTTRYKERLNVGYRNLALGVGVDPRSKLKRGLSLGLNSYGNKLGFNVEYLHENPYYGNASYGETTNDAVNASYSSLNVHLYYVYNRRFSMNAVYGLSYIQKRSAGSIFLTATGVMDKTDIRDLGVLGGQDITSSGIYVGIGAGYGYNYVLPHDWVLHASVLPYLYFVDKDRLSVDTDSRSKRSNMPNFQVSANFSVTHQMGKWFAGALCTFTEQGTGKTSYARTDYMTLMGRVSVGRRF